MSPKNSALNFLIIEDNEGLCFFSTLDESLGQQYRLIKLSYTPEFETQVTKLIDHCQESIQIEIQ